MFVVPFRWHIFFEVFYAMSLWSVYWQTILNNSMFPEVITFVQKLTQLSTSRSILALLDKYCSDWNLLYKVHTFLLANFIYFLRNLKIWIGLVVIIRHFLSCWAILVEHKIFSSYLTYSFTSIQFFFGLHV